MTNTHAGPITRLPDDPVILTAENPAYPVAALTAIATIASAIRDFGSDLSGLPLPDDARAEAAGLLPHVFDFTMASVKFFNDGRGEVAQELAHVIHTHR